MSNYVRLESEKYLKCTAEEKMVRHYKNRYAVRALFAFLIGLMLMPFAVYAGEHLCEWTPMLDEWIRESSKGKYQLPRVQLPELPRFSFSNYL